MCGFKQTRGFGRFSYVLTTAHMPGPVLYAFVERKYPTEAEFKGDKLDREKISWAGAPRSFFAFFDRAAPPGPRAALGPPSLCWRAPPRSFVAFFDRARSLCPLLRGRTPPATCAAPQWFGPFPCPPPLLLLPPREPVECGFGCERPPPRSAPRCPRCRAAARVWPGVRNYREMKKRRPYRPPGLAH